MGPIQPWVHEKLQQRCGMPALLQLGREDPVELVTKSLYRVTGMKRHYPRPSSSSSTSATMMGAGDQKEGVQLVALRCLFVLHMLAECSGRLAGCVDSWIEDCCSLSTGDVCYCTCTMKC